MRVRLQDKLKKRDAKTLWDEYCGFLDLDIQQYMYIQKRLFAEQIRLWSRSGLGRLLLGGAEPKTVEEFRSVMPLTTYDDYAETLLRKRADMLPDEPLVWIQTTGEGGLRPIKLAPYTRSMLDVYKHNIVAVMILASSRKKYDVNIASGDTVLYGGAPLPYATGLMPSLLDEDLSLTWLPDNNEHSKLSFSERIKKGFEIAFCRGIDYFFAIGSVANYITESFGKKGGGKGRKLKIAPRYAFRYLRAKYICKRDGRAMQPKDIFRIKGFVSAGTDAKCYKKKLGDAWGVMPIEIAAGTESTCMGAETGEQNGRVFFPDACFYELIPEAEMLKNIENPAYTPKTCLADEVVKDCNYELVISVFKGGAFARYRIGDVYRCVSDSVGGCVPRFTFVDRVPQVIDIAGFTRITEASVENVVALSKLGIGDWFARKEFTANNCPFLHLYLEMDETAMLSDAVSKSVLAEHLTVYFKHCDSDYEDLKKLLEIDPLQITILKSGTVKKYERQSGTSLPRINPSDIDVISLLRMHGNVSGREVKR